MCLTQVVVQVYSQDTLRATSDNRIPLEYRKALALDETEEEIGWLQSRYSAHVDAYMKHGFSKDDYEKLLQLLETKLHYLRANFETDASYEWHSGLNYIITGVKPE